MKDGDKVETRLTTKEVAKLYNKNESTIRRWAESGKLEAECIYNQFNSPAYLFAISALDKPMQEKYFAQIKASLPKTAKSISKKGKAFDHYSDSERQEIMWWEKTLKEWQNYRDRYPGDKAEADDKFVALCTKTDPEHTFSVKTLYRKKKQMETQGPQNVGYTFQAIQNLIALGYGEINLNCIYEEGWTVEHAQTLYQQLKQTADFLIENRLEDIYLSIFEEDFFRPKAPDDLQNWCGGTGDMISVDYTGNIYPCIRYMPNSLGPGIKPLTIGHVDHGILGTQAERDCAHCLKCIDRRTQSTDECFNCPIAEGCSWCSAYNYQVFGTADQRATFICVMHKARALANAYYWNRLYRERGEKRRFKIHVPEDWALEIISKEEWQALKRMEES